MRRFVQSAVSRLGAFFERTGRLRLRRELLQYSDRTLEDMGFSRQLLEAGVDAWPWRKSDGALISEVEYRNAVRELNAYSDTELADLGLRRADIRYAVRYGRPGIDNQDCAAA